jgi:hypothetical protein
MNPKQRKTVSKRPYIFLLFWSRGYGILVGIVAAVGYILAELFTQLITHDINYYAFHFWPMFMAALLAAALAYGMAKLLERCDKLQIVIDDGTGEEINLVRGDALFFLPVRYWPYIILVLGTILAIAHP